MLLNIDPKNIGAWYFKGRSLMYLGKTEEAIKSFEMVTIMDPENYEAF